MNEFIFDISFTESGWVSRLDESSYGLLETILKDHKNRSFNKTMNACCDYFFSHVKSENRPWKLSEEKIKKKFIEGFNIDWYWRVIISDLLPNLSDNDKISINIHHVRNWILLYVYASKTNEVQKKNRNNADFHDVIELKRSPIFGFSDRITSIDQYITYLSFKDIIIDRSRSLKSIDRLSNAYIMGSHKISYSIEVLNVEHQESRFSAKISSELDLEPTLKEFRVSGKSFSMHFPNEYINLPIFQNQDGTENNRHKETGLLLASDNFCNALQSSSIAWSDNSIDSIHINAPEGSGKKLIAKMFYNFRLFKNSLASGVLLGEENDLLALYGSTSSNGLISENNSCIILEDIHVSDENFRKKLLRFLETKQYLLARGHVFKIHEEDLAFVFLSNIDKKKLSQYKPYDFWRYLDLTVSYKSPFEIDKIFIKIKVIESYLHFYWCSNSIKFLQSKFPEIEKRNTIAEKYIDGIIRFISSKHLIKKIASQISKQLAHMDIEINSNILNNFSKKILFYFYQIFIYQVDIINNKIYEAEVIIIHKARKEVDQIIHDLSHDKNVNIEELLSLDFERSMEFIIQRTISREIIQ